MSKEKKQRLKEYQKNHCESKKSLRISSVFCCYLRHTTNIIINRIVFSL